MNDRKANRQEFNKLLTVEEAKQVMFKNFDYYIKNLKLDFKEIKAEGSRGYILSSDIISTIDLPRFNRSAMDGYAVKSSNTIGSSEDSPIQLELTGALDIDVENSGTLNENCAIKVATGSLIPENADSVIKIENTELRGKILDIYEPVTPGKNISYKGENVKKDSIVFPKHHKIRPIDISMLFDLGLKKIKVKKAIRVGVLSTGSELLSYKSDSDLKTGKIYDSNKPGIIAYLENYNAKGIDLGIARDDIESIKSVIESSIDNLDLLIITGGTSVGDKDLVPDAIKELGKIFFHGIAIRPGKPFGLGEVNKKPIFLLPGYPLATFINFELFIIPFVIRANKLSIPPPNEVEVTLGDRIPSKSGYRDFVRLLSSKNEQNLVVAKKIMTTGAGILSSLTSADYILQIPEDLEGYEAGTKVKVTVLK